MRLAILALAFVAFLVPAYAQDDNGGGGDNGAAASEPLEGQASDATASTELSPEEVACLPGGVTAAGVPCTAAPESSSSDPFATVSDPPTPKLIDFLGNDSTRL